MKKGILMAEKRNLLDELYDEMSFDSKNPLDNPFHPVEYAAPLAKIGQKIGKNIFYGSVAHGAKKGKSARDIIRDDMQTFGRSVHPIDVLNDLDAKKSVRDGFVNAYDNVERQRAFRTNQGQNKDYLAIRDVDEKNSRMDQYNEMKSKGFLENQSRRTYGVDSWQEWLAAKKAAKEAGHKVGRLFAEQNQREKNAYGNIAAGIGLSQNPVPKGTRPKFALGNQNHRYAEDPSKVEDAMSLSKLQRSGHEIHYLKDGTPVIDAYTWTQIPNIEKIKQTGYLAIEGSDTKNYHPGTEGQWTSNRDDYPMDSNYVNGVKIFGRGSNGESFNEELLHTRMPLRWYQKAPVIHQGTRAYGPKVDVIQARPSAPQVIVGEGDERLIKKIATPAEFIEHIPVDKMRPDWAPVWDRDMLPGSHPNKEKLGYNTIDALNMILGGQDESDIYDMGAGERRIFLLDLLKDENNKRKLLEKVVRRENQYNRLKDETKRKALKDYYVNLDVDGMTAYDIVNEGVNPPIK